MRFNELFFGGFFAVLGISAVLAAQTFPPPPGQAFGSALFPTLVGSAMTLCGFTLCVCGIRARPRVWFTAPAWLRAPREAAAVLWAFISLLLCALFVKQLGFILSITIIMAPLLAVSGEIKKAPLLCLGTAAAVELLFVWLLGSPLPRGMVEALFR